jgi:hypothetical protein
MDTMIVSTIMPPTQVEYKYILVTYSSGPRAATLIDLSAPPLAEVNFKLLLGRGWTPLREIPTGGGGDSTGTSIMLLLQREKRIQ